MYPLRPTVGRSRLLLYGTKGADPMFPFYERPHRVLFICTPTSSHIPLDSTLLLLRKSSRVVHQNMRGYPLLHYGYHIQMPPLRSRHHPVLLPSFARTPNGLILKNDIGVQRNMVRGQNAFNN